MFVRITRPVMHGHQVAHQAGDVVDLPNQVAGELVRLDFAVELDAVRESVEPSASQSRKAVRRG
jgi:hypothetical protein